MLATTPRTRTRIPSPAVTTAIDANVATAQARINLYLAGMRAGQLARHQATCRLCADPDGPGYCDGAIAIATRCDEATDEAERWQARREPGLPPADTTPTTLF
jgi:hypothetical protein